DRKPQLRSTEPQLWIGRKELNMRRFICVTIVFIFTIFISACGSKPSPEATAEFKDFDPGNFDNSIEITNPWMPMQPGTLWVYEGTAVDEEGNSFARRIEFTVTDLTKEIAGVRTVVAWIVDYNNGEVIEKEIAFYAQDN